MSRLTQRLAFLIRGRPPGDVPSIAGRELRRRRRLLQELALRATVSVLLFVFNTIPALSTDAGDVLRALALLGILVNVPYYVAVQRLPALRWQAYVRMIIDSLLVTIGVYAAGGLAAAPYLSVYLIVPVYVAFMLSSTACLVVTWVSTASYLAIALLQHTHWLPLPAQPQNAWAVAIFNLLIMNVVGILTALLAGAYRSSQRAVRASEERFRSVAESAGDAIVVADARGRIVSWNRGAERMFGYTAAEVVGRPISLLMPERYRDKHQRGVERFGSTGVSPLVGTTIELHGLRRDGSEFPLELSLATWRTGSETFVSGIIRDTTERSSLEAQLRQAQKMEAIGRLADGVAHDFNNLLTIVMGHTHFIEARLGPDDPSRRDTAIIQGTGFKAAALIKQLLTFSQAQGSEARIVDLRAVIDTMSALLPRLIGEHIELQLVKSAEAGWVKADPVQLEQVILNLAVNARDAMPEGGRLTIKTANVELDDAYARRHVGTQPGPYVVLMVSDTGVGMDAETQSHIFEPFFTTKEPDKGTGLGLATVYGIVKQGGGDIVVNSEPGRGTLMRIYLPRVEPPFDVVARAPTGPTRTRGSETILLVEDDEEIRTLVRHALEGQGYRVLAAATPNEALRIADLEVRPIDLIVTDIVMPQMSGRDLAERLTAVSPRARVLFMSGYADPGEGNPAFLAKPFTPDALARKIRAVLDAGSAPGEGAATP